MTGANVCIEYAIRLEDGTEVDSSEGEPWCFTLGDGSLAPGLEQAVASLAVGEEGQFLLAPDDAYGYRDEGLIFPVALADFPADIAVAPDAAILFATPSGEEIPGRVVEVGEADALVDFNPPLAGLTLIFQVHLRSREN